MSKVLKVSGNDPKALLNAPLQGAEEIYIDLYETVDESQRDAAELLTAEALAALDFSSSKLEALHQDTVNVFFLDGSVSSVAADEFDSKSYFCPKADGSGSEKVSGALR